MAKLYYSISEVSNILEEEQHILRYWEKEFKVLKPKKNSAGNRKYSHKDLEILKNIKQLVREKEMNLINAKEVIDNKKPIDNNFNNSSKNNSNSIEIDKEIIRESIKILKSISAKLKQM